MGSLVTVKKNTKSPTLTEVCIIVTVEKIYTCLPSHVDPFVCLSSPVPGSLSSLLHRNRQRQPLPASMPGTLPDPTMQGSSAVLMSVSAYKHPLLCTHAHTRTHLHKRTYMRAHWHRCWRVRLSQFISLISDWISGTDGASPFNLQLHILYILYFMLYFWFYLIRV